MVHEDPGHETYTVFSLWDTYRAAHPLYTLLQAGRVPDMVLTMLDIHDEQGMLPVWHLYGSDTREMIGIQSVPVIADALMKGIPGIDNTEMNASINLIQTVKKDFILKYAYDYHFKKEQTMRNIYDLMYFDDPSFDINKLPVDYQKGDVDSLSIISQSWQIKPNNGE